MNAPTKRPSESPPGCSAIVSITRIALAGVLLPLGVAAADPAQGRKLVEEKKCEACHQGKMRGDAKAIYLRKDRRVNSIEKLKAQVAACNSELNLQLFPDEEEHIVAHLDKTYYKFTAGK